MQVGIYKITSPDHKIYIGQTWDFKRRIGQYRNNNIKTQRKIYESIKKYGWQSHKIELVSELPKDVSQKVLNDYEIFYWNCYKRCGFILLNIKMPGSNGKHNSETKKKISAAKKGEKHPFFGKTHSSETINKMSKAQSGEKHPFFGKSFSLSHRNNISKVTSGEKNPFYGKKHTEETRKKISELKSGNKHPNYGKNHSDETILKMSQARKLFWKNKKAKDGI